MNDLQIQIQTAKEYPRDISRASLEIAELATLSKETAEACAYTMPRGGSLVTGPSVRMAEIAANCWGNSRSGYRILEVNKEERYLVSEGVFHDLEKNTYTTTNVRRSIGKKNGDVYSADMIAVTANAAGSIAKRNAILGGIPRAVWEHGYESALRVTRGDAKSLPDRIKQGVALLEAKGLDKNKLFAVLGITHQRQIDLDMINTMAGINTALKSGETSLSEILGDTEKTLYIPSGLVATKEVSTDDELITDDAQNICDGITKELVACKVEADITALLDKNAAELNKLENMDSAKYADTIKSIEDYKAMLSSQE